MLALIVVGGVIAWAFDYEQWRTWWRTTEWRRAARRRGDGER